MKLKHAMLAIAIAAVALFATSASAFEFHGYVRSGLGGTNVGGNQRCLALSNLDYVFRLGNECETYGELEFDESLYKDKNGVEFKGVFMLAYSSNQTASYEGLGRVTPTYQTATDANGNFVPYTYVNPTNAVGGTFNVAEMAFRQAWIGAKLPQLGDVTVWAGNRYYHRNDIHILDFYYWDPSGPGAGVEDIDLGFGKLAIAVFHSVGDNGLKTDVGAKNHGSPGEKSMWRPDIRVYGIPFFGGGSLEVGLDLFITDYNTNSQENALQQYGPQPGTSPNPPPTAVSYGANEEKVSPWVTVQHLQPNLLGGFNKLALQYAQGSAAPMSSYPQYGNTSDAKHIRVVDMFVFQPVPQFSGMFTLVYESVAQRYGGKDDYNTFDAITVGVRPVFHVNDYFKVQGEFGYQKLMPGDPKANGVPGDRELWKATIAPTLVAGGGFWSRPELRLFVSYFSWNDASRTRNVEGQNTWDYTKCQYWYWGCDTSGVSFGAQVEAWW